MLAAIVYVSKGEVRFVNADVRHEVKNVVATLGLAGMSHEKISVLCVEYLTLERIKSVAQHLESRTQHRVGLQKAKADDWLNDIGEYAAQYWPAHYRQADSRSPQAAKKIASLPRNEEWVEVWRRVDRFSTFPLLSLPETPHSAAYLSAHLGLKNVLELEMNSSLCPSKEPISELLEAAAGEAHTHVVRFLLEKCEFESTDISKALVKSLNREHNEVTEMVVKYPRFTQMASLNDEVLEAAAYTRNYQLIQSINPFPLSQYQRNLLEEKALVAVVETGNEEIVTSLLRSSKTTIIQTKVRIARSSSDRLSSL
jgi:hypothetical protein